MYEERIFNLNLLGTIIHLDNYTIFLLTYKFLLKRKEKIMITIKRQLNVKKVNNKNKEICI